MLKLVTRARGQFVTLIEIHMYLGSNRDISGIFWAFLSLLLE